MSSDPSAAYWIEQLGLIPHPEGGHYIETYRSSEFIPRGALPSRFAGARACATSIFYLLSAGDFSTFHKIHSDETWHFYAGGSLEIILLEAGSSRTVRLGRGLHRGEHLQFTVPAGTWFAARPAHGTEYALAGCTVSPGFDFADFEMGQREALCRQFPAAQSLIIELTRI